MSLAKEGARRAGTSNRQIVLVAYHFPPSTAVGALRPAQVAEALSRAGFGVDVIRATPRSREAGAASHGDGAGSHFGRSATVRVHTVQVGRGTREVVRDMVHACRRAVRTGGVRSSANGETLLARHVVRWMLALLRTPDDENGSIVPLYRAIRCHADRCRSVIYCSAPPASALVASALAARRTRSPLIVELRDPWVGNPGRGAHSRSGLSNLIERMLESACLHQAAHVVTVTKAVASDLRARYGASFAERISCVPNGIPDDARPTFGHRPRMPWRLVHAGSLAGWRDPRPVLDAITRLRERGDLGAEPIRLEFVGPQNVYVGVPVEQLAKARGAGDYVAVMPNEPRVDVLRRLASADALLLLAQAQPAQVPQKLYEYLGVRRPILALADDDGETARLLRWAGGHVVITDADPSRIADAIARLRAATDAGPFTTVAPSRLEELRTPVQMRRLVQLVDAVCR